MCCQPPLARKTPTTLSNCCRAWSNTGRESHSCRAVFLIARAVRIQCEMDLSLTGDYSPTGDYNLTGDYSLTGD